MGTGHFRGAAVAALCAALALASGCDNGGGAAAANIAGSWSGSLTLTFGADGSVPGALELTLGQEEDFASGVAAWSPVDEDLSVVVPIDGDAVTLRLNFRCTEELTGAIRTETALITGEVDGSTMTFSGASGRACPGGGEALEVTGGEGSVVRITDDRPL